MEPAAGRQRGDDTLVEVPVARWLENQTTRDLGDRSPPVARPVPRPDEGLEALLSELEDDAAHELRGGADELLSRLMNEAETLAADGHFFEAVELLELALVLEPRHDSVRARLHAMAETLVRPRSARGDDTVRLGV